MAVGKDLSSAAGGDVKSLAGVSACCTIQFNGVKRALPEEGHCHA